MVTVGQVFGSLTVIEKLDLKTAKREALWLVRCVCGTLRRYTSWEITRCPERNCRHRNNEKNTAYRCWNQMWSRCTNPNNMKFKHYGGRGIAIDPRWKDFTVFLEDMGPRPSKDHSVDRIDCDGGYNKENCRWATKAEQNRNKRNNAMIEIEGKTVRLVSIPLPPGLDYAVFKNRVVGLGWSIERALSFPVRTYRKRGRNDRGGNQAGSGAGGACGQDYGTGVPAGEAVPGHTGNPGPPAGGRSL